MAPVKIAGRWGYINKAGNTVIEPKYTEAYSFSEGLAVASNGSLEGYIDHSGRFELTPQYQFALPFDRGLAEVDFGRAFSKRLPAYINHQGEIIWKADSE
jgi:hypothetical protein